MKTTVVHVSNGFDVYIGRKKEGLGDGYFGNPYEATRYGRDLAISLFRSKFERLIRDDAFFKNRVLELAGKRLGCYCKTKSDPETACHGDVYVEYLDSLQPEVDKLPETK